MEICKETNIAAETLNKELEEAAPMCLAIMKPRLVEYIEGERLVMAFPVLDWELNPRGGMQGGFITAAFDNVFGAMCVYETKEREIATVDISTSYQRPIFKGDELIITVWIKSKGRTLVHLYAEGHNKEGKLIATSNTNFIILNNKNK